MRAQLRSIGRESMFGWRRFRGRVMSSLFGLQRPPLCGSWKMEVPVRWQQEPKPPVPEPTGFHVLIHQMEPLIAAPMGLLAMAFQPLPPYTKPPEGLSQQWLLQGLWDLAAAHLPALETSTRITAGCSPLPGLISEPLLGFLHLCMLLIIICPCQSKSTRTVLNHRRIPSAQHGAWCTTGPL